MSVASIGMNMLGPISVMPKASRAQRSKRSSIAAWTSLRDAVDVGADDRVVAVVEDAAAA